MANKKACSWRWMPEWISFGKEHNFTRWSPSRTPAVGKYGLLLQTLSTKELADSGGSCFCYVWSNSRTMDFEGHAINIKSPDSKVWCNVGVPSNFKCFVYLNNLSDKVIYQWLGSIVYTQIVCVYVCACVRVCLCLMNENYKRYTYYCNRERSFQMWCVSLQNIKNPVDSSATQRNIHLN